MAGDRRHLRASDADRDQTADRLRCAADEGRLLAWELDERLVALSSAHTYAELDTLVADLPDKRALVKRAARAKTSLRRPSDIDREQTVERLRNATAEGRLHVGEFEERLGQALSARTYRELGAIVTDLPEKRVVIKRLGRIRARRQPRSRMVKRAARAGVVVLRDHRTLIAGTLAAAAVAAPLTAVEVGNSAHRLSAPVSRATAVHLARGLRPLPNGTACIVHWTKASKWLPCDWGEVVSTAAAPRILRDVENAQ